ncbi:hypothetical protein BCR32DRAFT_278380 [Anaeromyces robustus]|uniref:BZIP domain-containing protein n=1 Tax=Anaeromyces robustus TaxID=1754192 RepID=A0A1Y1XBB5_9FUNG|nr:hypothetical protein BCR32DRAFT_278380 [Anaeromyces robustus]|eukprot:ORX83071.1 hypothetical protein BCR32DRAFT_278380 [Anaeromyces robustus]
MSSLNSLPVLKPKKVESTEQPKSDKEMERLRKIRERIIRNRASANASRQKKKQYLELLEKKNKELTQQKEIVDKENQQLKNENENLKLQIQYLNQTVNKMNAILNEKQQSIESIQLQNNILLSNNIYASPLSEISNNFTSSDINSPESLSNVSYPSPLFNDNSIYPFTSSPIITNLPINTNNNVNNTNDTTNIIDTNVNTIVNNVNALSPQSKFPAADTLLPENNATTIGNNDINDLLNNLLDDDLSLYNTDFTITTAEQQQQLQELISEKELYNSACSNFQSEFPSEYEGNELSYEQLLQLLEQQVLLLERQDQLMISAL